MTTEVNETAEKKNENVHFTVQNDLRHWMHFG